MLARYCYVDAGRRQEIPGSETKHSKGSAGSRSVSVLLPFAPKTSMGVSEEFVSHLRSVESGELTI